MRHALVVALQQFDGALIVVSHDRSLLGSCVDDFWLVADQKVSVFDGDLDDYRAWCAQRWQLHKQNNHTPTATTTKAVAQVPTVPAKSAATLQFEQKSLKQKISKLEKQMAILQTEFDQLQAWMASEAAYDVTQKEALSDATDRLTELTNLIAPLEEEWLGLNGEFEVLV